MRNGVDGGEEVILQQPRHGLIEVSSIMSWTVREEKTLHILVDWLPGEAQGWADPRGSQHGEVQQASLAGPVAGLWI